MWMMNRLHLQVHSYVNIYGVANKDGEEKVIFGSKHKDLELRNDKGKRIRRANMANYSTHDFILDKVNHELTLDDYINFQRNPEFKERVERGENISQSLITPRINEKVLMSDFDNFMPDNNPLFR
mmetsp:Transcript_18031/g.30724  ORF Transcript_18031/g.30724 Transcript_18031/m.30724 type:complete len:125 (-) Transcript_18031:35-409(-)